jgi:hypothetical protein
MSFRKPRLAAKSGVGQLTVTVAAILIAAATFAFWIFDPIDLNTYADVLPGHQSEFDYQNTKFQKITYLAVVAFLAAAVIWTAFFEKKHGVSAHARSLNHTHVLICSASLIAVVKFSQAGKLYSLALLITTIAAIALTATNGRIPKMVERVSQGAAILAVAVFFVVLICVPFLVPVTFDEPATFVLAQLHYAMTTAPGQDIICCEEVGKVERANYGIAMPMLTASLLYVQSLFSPPSMSSLALATKFYQLVFALLSGFAVFLASRRNIWIAFLLLLLLSPNLNTFGWSLYYPNLGGIRYLPFLLATIFLIYYSQRSKPNLFHISLASALALICNLETGVAITGGFLVLHTLQSFSKSQSPTRFFNPIFAFLTSTSVSFAILAYATAPIIQSADMFSFLAQWAAGYGGWKGKLHFVAAMLIFFCSLYILRAVRKARDGAQDNEAFLQAAIASAILLWLPYYINGMLELYLWFHTLLFVLMIAPQIHFSALRLLQSGSPAITIVTVGTVGLLGVLLAVSARSLHRDYGKLSVFLQSDCPISQSINQPVCLANPALVPTAAYLAQTKAGAKVDKHLYLSLRPVDVRMHGLNEGFPWYDPFGEVATRQHLESIVRWIQSHPPEQIHIDSPKSVLARAVPAKTEQLHLIVKNLKGYVLFGEDENWQHYRRVE